MGGILIIGLIITVIILIIKNNELSDKINKLNKQNSSKYCPNCGFDLVKGYDESINTPNTNSVPVTNTYVANKVTNNVKKDNTISDKSIKNSFILIAGALLIIISAITLLTSTWSYSHDIFKTLIISFMFLVFLGSSYIAKEKLKLNLISKVFLYIAMAYLPLIFLSISLFSLLGDFLSINGEGNYLYLAISSIVLSIIYFVEMKRNKDILISIYGNIFHLLSIIFLSLIFTNNIYIIIFALSVYTLLYSLINVKNKYYYSIKVDKILLSIYTISLFVISVWTSLYININIFYILSLIVYLLLTYIILNRLYEKNNVYNYIYPLLILFITFNIPSLFDKSLFLYLIFILLGSILIFILDYIRNNHSTLLHYIYITVIIGSLYLVALFSSNAVTLSLFLLGYLLISIIYYIYLNNNKGMASCIIPIVFMLFISHLSYSLGISNLFISLIFSIIFIISSLIKIKDNIFKYTLNISSIVFMSIYYLIQIFTELNTITLLFSIYMFGILFVLYVLTKRNTYKILSYICLNLTVMYVMSLYKINIFDTYSIFISLLIIFGIELINKFKNKAGTIFLFIQFIIAFLAIFEFSNNIILLIILILGYELYLYINKLDFKYNYLPLIIVGIFSITYNEIYNVIMYMIIFGLLLLYTNTNNKTLKDVPIMTYVLSGFLLLCDYNKYLKIILFILLFGYYLYLFKKDYIKLFLYISITVLLRFICVDTGLGDITLFNYGLYIVLFILCSIDIFRKNINWYKVIEYIGLILLYLMAMGRYLDELDGLLFVCLILIFTIFGYIKKYGPIFIVSLIFVLINMFYLTSEFWLSIPWWIYLLVVGIILIVFAIYNEMNEKKNKNIIKEFFNKLDL